MTPQTPHRSPRRQALGLLACLVLTAIAAALGAMATAQAATVYAQLARPAWAPPGWLFGPVWTLLYLMMAVAAWLVWRSAPFNAARAALTLYGAQLAANALWSWLFFAWQQGAWALAEVLVLWLLIALCVMHFARLSRVAAALLLPYLVWVSFASALTWACWRLNPTLL